MYFVQVFLVWLFLNVCWCDRCLGVSVVGYGCDDIIVCYGCVICFSYLNMCIYNEIYGILFYKFYKVFFQV